jgi:hypothetical protein
MRNTSALASSPHGTPRARSRVGASTATHAKDTTGIHLRTASGSVATAASAAQSAPSPPSTTSSAADPQRAPQPEVGDERGVPSPAGAAVRGPHALTVPPQQAAGIIRLGRANHPQV